MVGQKTRRGIAAKNEIRLLLGQATYQVVHVIGEG